MISVTGYLWSGFYDSCVNTGICHGTTCEKREIEIHDQFPNVKKKSRKRNRSKSCKSWEKDSIPREVTCYNSIKSNKLYPSKNDEDDENQNENDRSLKGIIIAILIICLILIVRIRYVIELPLQPVGPYQVFEVQEGEKFWDHYDFYVGPDSEGSNGYINYISKEKAFELGIANVTVETVKEKTNFFNSIKEQIPHIYMASSPTAEGPRDSIRLEGKSRFEYGLFIMDLSHMPAGCGTWPAFWLTAESNWPNSGEIDILEGVNYQTHARTALHTSDQCVMDDIPWGVHNGGFDLASGIPDAVTGVPDKTVRESNNCYAYAPHQWLNQGCVLVNNKTGTIGEPFNAGGGGIYALEWDPANRHIRSWVFNPHSDIPNNLKNALKAVRSGDEDGVVPDPNSWGLPFGYFPIGRGTHCSINHFTNMRIVINLTFCGSVSGNRFSIDCIEESKVYSSCIDYLERNADAFEEAYWKIRGVYVFKRSFGRKWF